MTDWQKAKETAEKLVDRMTPAQQASQLQYEAPGIGELQLPAYNWWNEALHGVARAGTATVFPQAIGLAATFDQALIGRIGHAIGMEGRAKYNLAQNEGDAGIYKGLTFWSPNINIFRDPRWGRGQETLGEDPYLTALLGCAFVNGLQGQNEEGNKAAQAAKEKQKKLPSAEENGPEYLLAAGCAKHFAAHSGPEASRHGFDAKVSAQDLAQTYLPAFEELVCNAGVAGVMGAYNAINGQPCCLNDRIAGLLRNKWGFRGYFVSDCGALADIYQHHLYKKDAIETAVSAVESGCDIACGQVYASLAPAVEAGLVNNKALREAATRVLTVRAALGMFDPDCYWNSIGIEEIDSPEHRQLNVEAACRSAVLLKNEDGFLPICQPPKTVAVIGPNAQSVAALEGNYCGTASRYVTAVDGIRSAWPDSRLYYAAGCHLYREKTEGLGETDDRIAEAVAYAKAAQLVVVCIGLDPHLEGEEGDAYNSAACGDKMDLSLPESQKRLLAALQPYAEKTVAVCFSGSCIDLEEYTPKAVLQMWYPGAEGGNALAALLTGKENPCGRLPITFYRAKDALPPMEDYSMEGRTYRFLRQQPLYPFGYGLSYTSFQYSNLKLQLDGSITVSVKNTGHRTGREAAQLYASFTAETLLCPSRQLCGIRNITLAPGEETAVTFHVQNKWLSPVDREGNRVMPQKLEFFAGGHQPDEQSCKLAGSECCQLAAEDLTVFFRK